MKKFLKIYAWKEGKKRKNVKRVFFTDKMGTKKLFWWMLWYLLFEHLWKTPSCRRKLHPKSEKKFYKYLTYFFGCCRAAKYPVYEFTFTFHVFYLFVRDWTVHFVPHKCIWNNWARKKWEAKLHILNDMQMLHLPLKLSQSALATGMILIKMI